EAGIRIDEQRARGEVEALLALQQRIDLGVGDRGLDVLSAQDEKVEDIAQPAGVFQQMAQAYLHLVPSERGNFASQVRVQVENALLHELKQRIGEKLLRQGRDAE